MRRFPWQPRVTSASYAGQALLTSSNPAHCVDICNLQLHTRRVPRQGSLRKQSTRSNKHRCITLSTTTTTLAGCIEPKEEILKMMTKTTSDPGCQTGLITDTHTLTPINAIQNETVGVTLLIQQTFWRSTPITSLPRSVGSQFNLPLFHCTTLNIHAASLTLVVWL